MNAYIISHTIVPHTLFKGTREGQAADWVYLGAPHEVEKGLDGLVGEMRSGSQDSGRSPKEISQFRNRCHAGGEEAVIPLG